MPSTQPPGTALVIEADQQVRRACSAMLAGAGMQVSLAAAPDEALATVALGGIDVVVAPIGVGPLSGTELLREIRARDPELPVIFVTRWPDFGDAGVAGDEGRDAAVALRGAVVTAAVGYRVGRRARRRSVSPVRGEPLRHPRESPGR